MRKTSLPWLCCLAALSGNAWFVCGTPAVRADDIKDFITVGDYIDSGSPTSHFNSKFKLVVNSGANTTVTRGLFQLPAAAADIPASDVVDAKIWLDLTWDNETNPYARGAMLYPLEQSFDGNTVTWNTSSGTGSGATAWTTGGGLYDSADGIAWNPPVGIPSSQNTNMWVSFDVTSLWNNPNLFANGALLMFDQSEAQPSSGFITKQFSNATSGAYQPYLEITTVPEPSSIALVLAGAGLLAVRFGRRRACLAAKQQAA